MTITIQEPTGKIQLEKYCFDVREHDRSSYTRSDGTFVTDSEVDEHIRCLYMGIDTGILAASGGELVYGYSIHLHDPRKGSGKTYLGSIYFRTREEAEKYIADMDQLLMPGGKPRRWAWNKLKNPRPASDFDALDYEAKIRKGIARLRAPDSLTDSELQMHRVIERLKLADERSKTPKAMQAFAEAAEQAQENAEDLAKGAQSALRNMERRMEQMAKKLEQVDDKLKDFTVQQMEQTRRAAEKMGQAVNQTVEDNVKAVARYGVELATAERRIKVEQENIETLSKALRDAEKAKDAQKAAEIAEKIAGARKRLQSAEGAKWRAIQLIEGVQDVIEVKQRMKKPTR